MRPKLAVSMLMNAGLLLWGSAAAAATTLKPEDLALINRLTWGLDAASVAQFEQLGSSDWLERQLRPAPSDSLPPAAQAQIDDLAISHASVASLVMQSNALGRAARELTDPAQRQAAQVAYQQALNDLARQAATRSLLRDLYSHRRKNLRGALMGFPARPWDKAQVDARLASLGIDGSLRAETLDVEQHRRLSELFA